MDQLYPYAYYSTSDGFWLAGHYSWASPLRGADRPEPYFASVRLDAGLSTEGSRFAVIDAQAPAYWDGWRLGLTLTAARANRLGYFGQGNGAPYDRDSITAASPYFYRVGRSTLSARVTVQRRIVGPLRVLAGATVERTDFRTLPGQNRFRQDLAGGAVDPATVPFADRVARIGVVFDWREEEINPHRGFFAEALVSRGRGYTRTTAIARAYVHPLERVVLAGRVGVERMTGAPPVAAQLWMESSEGPMTAVGGYRTLRGYYEARFVGPGKVVAGLEARYSILWAPRILELKLVAFYDAGRVFTLGERVRLTGDGLHSAGGGEVAVSLLRNSLIVLGFGKGSDGAQFVFGTTWSY